MRWPVLLLVLLCVTPALADETRVFRAWTMGLRDGHVEVSFDVADLFDVRSLERLGSGLTHRIYIAVSVRPAESGEPLRDWLRTCEIVYDLWEERYGVEVVQRDGRRFVVRKTAAEAAQACGVVSAFAMATAAQVDPKTAYVLEAVVRVNPVSPELKSKAKEYFQRGFQGGGDRTMFGSAMLFFIRPRTQDPVFHFVSPAQRLRALPPAETRGGTP